MNAANKAPPRRRAGIVTWVEGLFNDRRAMASFMRFAAVGVFATLVHGLALNLLVLGAGLHPTLANVGAFLSAFSVSYLGHYYFSFRSRQDHVAAAPKFFVAALIGLTLNTLIFAIVVNLLQLHYMLAFAAVIVILPPIMFLISRKFVFAPGEGTGAGKAPVGQMRRRLIAYAPAGVFFLITAIYVVLFHFKAPYFDQWSFVTLYRSVEEGDYGLGSVFALHGAHWHSTAYLILYGLAEVTDMNHLYEGMASVFFALVGFLGLAHLIRRGAGESYIEDLKPLMVGLCAALWFSLDQAANWLWGWQVAVFINTAGAVWCIVMLASPRLTIVKFVIAIVAAGASILSFATGLTLLPLGLLLLFFQMRRRETGGHARAKYFFAVWAVLSIAVAMTYWRLNFVVENAYGRGVAATPQDLSLLLTYVQFFVNFIAAPISKFATDLALPVFGAGVFLVVWSLWKSGIDFRRMEIRPLYLALLALMAYGGGAAILTGLGRAVEFGASQGASGRYISFGNFFWIGAMMMALLALARAGRLSKLTRPAAPFVVIIVLCTLKFGNTVSISKKYVEQDYIRNDAIEALIAARPEIDRSALLAFASPQQNVEADLKFLERRNLSFFREPKDAE